MILYRTCLYTEKGEAFDCREILSPKVLEVGERFFARGAQFEVVEVGVNICNDPLIEAKEVKE